MNMGFYTNEQVHQIVDQLLLQFDEAAPGPEPVSYTHLTLPTKA